MKLKSECRDCGRKVRVTGRKTLVKHTVQGRPGSAVCVGSGDATYLDRGEYK